MTHEVVMSSLQVTADDNFIRHYERRDIRVFICCYCLIQSKMNNIFESSRVILYNHQQYSLKPPNTQMKSYIDA